MKHYIVKQNTPLFRKVKKHLDRIMKRTYTIHLVGVSGNSSVKVNWSYFGETNDCKVLCTMFITLAQLQETWNPPKTRRPVAWVKRLA